MPSSAFDFACLFFLVSLSCKNIILLLTLHLCSATLWSAATSWLLKCYFFRFSLTRCRWLFAFILPVIKVGRKKNKSYKSLDCGRRYFCFRLKQFARSGWVGESSTVRIVFMISSQTSRFDYLTLHCFTFVNCSRCFRLITFADEFYLHSRIIIAWSFFRKFFTINLIA